MSEITIQQFDDSRHRQQVINLWQLVFAYRSPHNQPDVAIDRKLAVADELFFVAANNEAVIGTIMAGYDGHRGWIYSLAVHPNQRRRGIGSQLMVHAERALAARGCVKINLQILPENKHVAQFYQSLGYAIEERISMGKPIL